MVLNSLLQEQPDGSFHWSTDKIEVRVYHESLESGEGADLGWSGYVWPAKSNPWLNNYLFHTAGRATKEEATLAVEEFLRERRPEELPEEPPSALLRLSGEEDLF
jgi:hypothetical protein